MDNSHASRKPGKVLFLALYYLILCEFLAGHYFPELRVWGINAWAYFPLSVAWFLFAIGAAAPLIPALYKAISGRTEGKPFRLPPQMYLVVTILIIVGFGLLFYWLRARTHFLGDGYLLLGKLEREESLIKVWDIVSNAVYRLMFYIGDGNIANSPLFAYQTISILSGVAFLAIVATAARALFEQATDRILFLLGMASSGFCLLFYGYVENYPLFVLSVAGFCLVGLLSARGRMNKLWILLPLAAAIATHIFGITLIPAALYLWLAGSQLSVRLSRISRPSRWLIGTVVFIALSGSFLYLYSSNLPFRFAIVPLTEDRFTPEGYSLLSFKHVIDFLNLLVLLLPALPIFILLHFSLPLRKVFRGKEYRFLMILSASALVAVFIFNPRLGMPRDWDLFSYAGVPLAALYYYLVIDQRKMIRSYRVILSFSVLLGFLLLFPRAAGFANPEIGLSRFRNYANLDKLKNRAARGNLVKYYMDRGDIETAHLETLRREEMYPQTIMATKAESLFVAGQVGQAAALCRQAIRLDPIYEVPYYNLGCIYLQTKRADSALAVLSIAAGLNQYHSFIRHNLGIAYLFNKHFTEAEEEFLIAINLNDTMWDSHMFLLNLYQLQERPKEYQDHLGQLDSGTYKRLTDQYPHLLQGSK